MESSKVRKPAVAGQFYPGTAQGLKREIGSLIDKTAQKQDIVACMLPHAGYAYSGRVAAETVSHINIKEKVVLLGPNHTGYGTAFSIMAEGAWQTPLGEVKIDSALARKILSGSKYLQDDCLAHMYEHSLEVEIPFLQYFKSDFQIVPIAFLSDDLAALKEVGIEVAEAIKDLSLENSVMIVASSDMTHYESQGEASRKDNEAIKAILELNEDKLMERIRSLGISMCGYAPAVAMIAAAKELGAKNAKLIKYQTSGEVTGDTDSVVGYAGLIIY
jgi:hypothetical protein